MLYTISYYAGIFSCSFVGAMRAHRKGNGMLRVITCALLAVFGGGMVFRDTLFLRTVPSVFHSGFDVLLALSVTAIYLHHADNQAFQTVLDSKPAATIITVADGLGLSAFVIGSVDKASEFGVAWAVIIACGTMTGIGGGILSTILRGDNPFDANHRNLPYKAISLISSILHYSLKTHDVTYVLKHNVVITATLIACLCNDGDVKNYVLMKYRSAIRIRSFTFLWVNSISVFYIPTSTRPLHLCVKWRIYRLKTMRLISARAVIYRDIMLILR